MSAFELIALAGFAVAAAAMLLVTQTKERRVSASAWLVPVVAVVPFAVWTGIAVAGEGIAALLPALAGSDWRLQVWFDRLMSVTAAFFLLQNRARAAGMKSELWVLFVIFTGSIGLLLMLARTLYLERKAAVEGR